MGGLIFDSNTVTISISISRLKTNDNQEDDGSENQYRNAYCYDTEPSAGAGRIEERIWVPTGKCTSYERDEQVSKRIDKPPKCASN